MTIPMVHEFVSGENSIVFSGENGAILAFRRRGRDLAAAANTLFTVYLHDGSKICAGDFADFSFDGRVFHYSGCAKVPGMVISIYFRAENGSFYFHPEVVNAEFDRINPVELIGLDGGEVLYPGGEGALLPDSGNRNKYCPTDSYIHAYPGRCQMQFLAHLLPGETGFYFSAQDKSHAPKRIFTYGDENNQLRFCIECYGETPFELRLCGFDGDSWMDAAEFYRQWVENEDLPEKPANLPAWLDDSPVTIIVSVRSGRDFGHKVNQFVPYRNIFPVVERIAEATKSKTLTLLMRWDRHGSWLPPYLWPPVGGAKSLGELEKKIHAAGHRLGLYGSGASWTQKSLVNNFSGERDFEDKRLDRFMTRRHDGELDEYTFPGLRVGYYMCLNEPWCRETIREQIRLAAAANMDVFQFFDQDLGGCVHHCYAKNHHHPPTPGLAETHAMQGLLEEIADDLKGMNSQMLLGTESAASEAFLSKLAINDLRPHSNLAEGTPVPLYNYVYHQYVNNFMGNQCSITTLIDAEKSPHNLLFRIAWFFVAGDMLTVSITENGDITWGAGARNATLPDQSAVLTLIGNLNALRRKHPAILRYGRMIKPAGQTVSGGKKYLLHLLNRVEEVDSVLFSCWESADGKRFIVFANYLPEVQNIQWNGRELSLNALDGVCLALE